MSESVKYQTEIDDLRELLARSRKKRIKALPSYLQRNANKLVRDRRKRLQAELVILEKYLRGVTDSIPTSRSQRLWMQSLHGKHLCQLSADARSLLQYRWEQFRSSPEFSDKKFGPFRGYKTAFERNNLYPFFLYNYMPVEASYYDALYRKCVLDETSRHLPTDIVKLVAEKIMEPEISANSIRIHSRNPYSWVEHPLDGSAFFGQICGIAYLGRNILQPGSLTQTTNTCIRLPHHAFVQHSISIPLAQIPQHGVGKIFTTWKFTPQAAYPSFANRKFDVSQVTFKQHNPGQFLRVFPQYGDAHHIQQGYEDDDQPIYHFEPWRGLSNSE